MKRFVLRTNSLNLPNNFIRRSCLWVKHKKKAHRQKYQSTYNPNMPLRLYLDFAELLSDFTKNLNLYGSTLIDGTMLELKVDVYNVNVGHNREMMEACKTLGEYAEYVSRVRKYAAEMPTTELAVERAIDECIKEDILRDFLQTQRAEAKVMSIYEYDQEAHLKMEREEWFEKGQEAAAEKVKEAEAKVAEANAEIARLREELARLRKA